MKQEVEMFVKVTKEEAKKAVREYFDPLITVYKLISEKRRGTWKSK